MFQHDRRHIAALALGALFWAGCEQTKIGPPQVDAPDATVTQDAAVTPDIDDGVLRCTPQPGDVDADCPEGMLCNTQAGVCVDCLVFDTRCNPNTRRHETCQPTEVVEGELVTGGVFEPSPCKATEACFEDPNTGDALCERIICEPLEFSCNPDDLNEQRQCGPFGVKWFPKTCSAGKMCSEGTCREIRSNVLLIFDTSGSMVDIKLPDGDCLTNPTVPCLTDFPECDQTVAPLTPMDLAKQVFTAGILDAVDQNATFALQRFPMRQAANRPGSCRGGWYAATPDGVMTGDDNSRTTEPGGWFDANLGQVVVTRFPTRPDGSTTDELLKWLDRDEQLTTTSQSCSSDLDCDSLLCESTMDGQRCVTHLEPELRGDGGTPLGKSLFYAGEYLRRFVLVDGKPCVESADCGSANYSCQDGQCVDEVADCRRPTIVLFTDGGESTPPEEFFKAAMQAKRLRYGLGCQTHDDCASGAQCGSEGYCLPTEPGPVLTDFVAGDGHEVVRAPNGKPLGIRVHVVNLDPNSSVASASIAAHGGGLLFDVSTDDPTEFETQVKNALRVNPKECD